MKIKFIKKAAYVYDLAFLFFLYFNKEFCLSNFLLYHEGKDNHSEHYNKLLGSISPIPKELLLFFVKNDYGKTFFTWNFFHPCTHLFAEEEYDLSTVIKALFNDTDRIKTDMFRYYFENADIEILKSAENPLLNINRFIQESSYSDELKNSMYAFFIDPEGVLKTLAEQLTEKDKILSRYYKENTLLLQKLQHKIQWEPLSECLTYIASKPIDPTIETVYVSFTLCNNYLLLYKLQPQKALLFLGASYEDTVNSVIKQNQMPDLSRLGTVLAEPNRIKMLNYIAHKKEISIKDIQKEFGFTAANSYYHLNKMQEAGILLTRNQGKMILFHINRVYFQRLCDVFKKYSPVMEEEI